MTAGLELETPRLRDFTAEQLDTALLELARYGGNSNRALPVVHEAGVNVSQRQLQNWKLEYPLRYHEACKRFAERIEGQIIARQREVALKGSEKVMDALDELDEAELSHKDKLDIAKRVQSLQIGAVGVAGTKILELSGRPTVTVEHRSVQAFVQAHRQFVIDADVVDDNANESATATDTPSRELTRGSADANALEPANSPSS